MTAEAKFPAKRPVMRNEPTRSYPHLIPVIALGMGLSLFLALSYLLCIVAYLFVPSVPIAHSALALVLPGFTLLNWTSFFLGLIESLAWGWYVALVFGPIYNFFVAR